MALNTNSNTYTIVFSIIMVVVVGFLLSFVATSLSDTIEKNKELEKKQNILYSMGVNENQGADVVFVASDKVEKVFDQYIKKQLVFYQDGRIEEDANAYNIDIKKEKADHKSDESKRKFPILIGDKDGEEYYIIPMRGVGLWDAIWGYISMDKNMVVKGVFFDHDSETPGLGAKIGEKHFMDHFTGEHLLDENNNFVSIQVAKGNADPRDERKTDHKVDAISGATITGNGVSNMLLADLAWYVPFFEKINQKN